MRIKNLYQMIGMALAKSQTLRFLDFSFNNLAGGNN
jgi:hypothetical protein